VGHRLGLATMTQISVCKLPFSSAGTAVSMFRAKTERNTVQYTNVTNYSLVSVSVKS